MTTLSIRDRVLADLVAGGTFLDVALRHGINDKTAMKWFAESGLTRTPCPTNKPVTPERRKAIERMIRDALPLATIRARAKCNNRTIATVRAEMEGEHV